MLSFTTAGDAIGYRLRSSALMAEATYFLRYSPNTTCSAARHCLLGIARQIVSGEFDEISGALRVGKPAQERVSLNAFVLVTKRSSVPLEEKVSEVLKSGKSTQEEGTPLGALTDEKPAQEGAPSGAFVSVTKRFSAPLDEESLVSRGTSAAAIFRVSGMATTVGFASSVNQNVDLVVSRNRAALYIPVEYGPYRCALEHASRMTVQGSIQYERSAEHGGGKSLQVVSIQPLGRNYGRVLLLIKSTAVSKGNGKRGTVVRLHTFSRTLNSGVVIGYRHGIKGDGKYGTVVRLHAFNRTLNNGIVVGYRHGIKGDGKRGTVFRLHIFSRTPNSGIAIGYKQGAAKRALQANLETLYGAGRLSGKVSEQEPVLSLCRYPLASAHAGTSFVVTKIGHLTTLRGINPTGVNRQKGIFSPVTALASNVDAAAGERLDTALAADKMRLAARRTCSSGMYWEELWDDLIREYGERTDRLQLPPVDFDYNPSRLYDRTTGEPYYPLTSPDRPEVMVAFPGVHPVNKHADVGLKIVDVHLWVLRDIILLLYRDLKEHIFQYEALPPGEAIRVALDRLLYNLRNYDYRSEEYQRAFRQARWYGEHVIVSTNNYWLVRDYDCWCSHEASVNLIDGLPAEDRPYIVRAEGWRVDPSIPAYITTERQAVLELKIRNLISTTFDFTVEIVNPSGSAAVRFTIDGKDKSYLLSSFSRIEADLPAGEHSILFEFFSESDIDRLELNAMKVDYVNFKSAQVIEQPRDVNGTQAVNMLIDMLLYYYEMHHEGKTKGTRLYRLAASSPLNQSRSETGR